MKNGACFQRFHLLQPSQRPRQETQPLQDAVQRPRCRNLCSVAVWSVATWLASEAEGTDMSGPCSPAALENDAGDGAQQCTR